MALKPKMFSNSANYTNSLIAEEVELILDDIEFAWKTSDIDKVIKMWKENKSIEYIMNEIDRDGDEIFLLLLHLSRKRRIKKRKNFIWGEV